MLVLMLLLQMQGSCAPGDRVVLERKQMTWYYKCGAFGTWVVDEQRAMGAPSVRQRACPPCTTCPTCPQLPKVQVESDCPTGEFTMTMIVPDSPVITYTPPRPKPSWLPQQIADRLPRGVPPWLLEQSNKGWVKDGGLMLLWLVLAVVLWRRANKPTWTDNRWAGGLEPGQQQNQRESDEDDEDDEDA